MKISKNSWHYKFNRWWRSEGRSAPNNLCGYMRETFINIIITCLVAALSATIFYFMVILFFITIYESIIYQRLSEPLIQWFWSVFSLAVIGDMSISFIRHETYSGQFWWNKPIKLFGPKYQTEYKPNIFKVYIKALHDKTCPLVEYDED